MVRDEDSAMRIAMEDSEMEYNPVVSQQKIKKLKEQAVAKDEKITQLEQQFGTFADTISN